MIRYVVFMFIVAFLVQCNAEVNNDILKSYNAIRFVQPYPVAGETETIVSATEPQIRGRGQIKVSFLEDPFGVREAFANLYSRISIALSAYLLAFSLLTIIPFIWFCIAGAAVQLYNGYVVLNFVLGTQTIAYTVTQILSFNTAATVFVLIATLVITLTLAYSDPPKYEDCTTYWAALILANLLLTNLILLMPVTNILTYWTFLILIAIAVYYAFLYVPADKKRKNAWAVGFASAYGTVSALSCILGLFGISTTLDFVTFFSSASFVLYTNVPTIILLLIWIALVGCCCYVYNLREELQARHV